jgi:hypothetical protein
MKNKASSAAGRRGSVIVRRANVRFTHTARATSLPFLRGWGVGMGSSLKTHEFGAVDLEAGCLARRYVHTCSTDDFYICTYEMVDDDWRREILRHLLQCIHTYVVALTSRAGIAASRGKRVGQPGRGGASEAYGNLAWGSESLISSVVQMMLSSCG